MSSTSVERQPITQQTQADEAEMLLRLRRRSNSAAEERSKSDAEKAKSPRPTPKKSLETLDASPRANAAAGDAPASARRPTAAAATQSTPTLAEKENERVAASEDSRAKRLERLLAEERRAAATLRAELARARGWRRGRDLLDGRREAVF